MNIFAFGYHRQFPLCSFDDDYKIISSNILQLYLLSSFVTLMKEDNYRKFFLNFLALIFFYFLKDGYTRISMTFFISSSDY